MHWIMVMIIFPSVEFETAGPSANARLQYLEGIAVGLTGFGPI